MKSKSAIALLIMILLLGVYYYLHSRSKDSLPSTSSINIKSKTMQITSPAFGENEIIPSKFTCDGESVSPALEISSVPESAKSLAIIIHDPDAPVAGGFTHWVVFNINPDIKEIKENSVPENAIEGTISTGKTGYTGPCPPSGTHHYQFKLYALDSMLNLDSSARKEDVEKAMEGHILDQTILVGLYKR